MLRSIVRVSFVMAVSLSLALGVFFVSGYSVAMAASDPAATADGYNPVASTPPGVDYCYPTGYNRNGWRCGWRLAQAPYNLGDYYRYYYGYYYPYYYYPYGNWGTGGYPTNITDYGGRPRFGPYYNWPYYNGGYYNPCGYNNPYCWQPVP